MSFLNPLFALTLSRRVDCARLFLIVGPCVATLANVWQSHVWNVLRLYLAHAGSKCTSVHPTHRAICNLHMLQTMPSAWATNITIGQIIRFRLPRIIRFCTTFCIQYQTFCGFGKYKYSLFFQKINIFI